MLNLFLILQGLTIKKFVLFKKNKTKPLTFQRGWILMIPLYRFYYMYGWYHIQEITQYFLPSFVVSGVYPILSYFNIIFGAGGAWISSWPSTAVAEMVISSLSDLDSPLKTKTIRSHFRGPFSGLSVLIRWLCVFCMPASRCPMSSVLLNASESHQTLH